jgi:hypothetical protein
MLKPSESARLRKWLGVTINEEYADSFFSLLGAKSLKAIDASRYEGAEVIHNLNAELPAELHEQFSCLIDGGTLEHIFDVRQSFKSSMEMVRVGGHFISCQMANNCMGHGFYQFGPEFFYSIFTHDNGYELEFVVLNEDGIWYEPLAPAKIRERVQARTRSAAYIFAVARRVSSVAPFRSAPHQSDYVWNLGQQEMKSTQAPQRVGAISRIRRIRRILGDLKRDYLYAALPRLWEWEERLGTRRYVKRDLLSNEKRFRYIGRSLQLE